MDDHRGQQLATFLQHASLDLRSSLTEEAFDCYLASAFESAFESDEHDCVLNTLKSAKIQFLKLKPDDPHPPKWIDYNKPLVSRSGLYDIIMEWKTEGHDVYDFEALRCYVLAHCFQPVA